MIKTLRAVHFYLGVFFAPSIIFFAFSGALQAFSLHENHLGKPGIPWVTALAEVHKNQRVPKTWTGSSEAPPNAAPAARPKPSEGGVLPAGEEKPAAPKAIPEGNASASGAAAPSTPQSERPATPPRQAPRPKSVPLKVFVAIMTTGLITTSLLGIYMAFKYARGAALIWGLLVLGSVLPALLLYL